VQTEQQADGSSTLVQQQAAPLDTLHSLLATLRAHPAVLFLSADQPLSVSAAGVAVRAGAEVPPGVLRIGAASWGFVGSASSVSVAVLDTGVALASPMLNVHNGVNCIDRIARAVRRGRISRRLKARSNKQQQQENEDKEEDGDSSGSTDDDDTEGESSELADAGEELPAEDGNNHGTHVAGIIAGRNAPGSLVGVAPGTVICQTQQPLTAV